MAIIKKIFVLAVMAVASLPVFSKNTPTYGEINPEFIKYVEKIKSDNYKFVTKDGRGLGFIPSPLIYTEAPDYLISEDNKLKAAAVIPSSYDSRDDNLITSVKDQGPQGACWTFGTIAAIESNWIKRGKGTFDLSEENVANCHGLAPKKNEGGTFEMATAYLTSLKGPVLESFDPYNPNVASAVCKAGTPVALITEGRILLYNEKNIKKAIMENGSIAAAINMGEYEKYYNSSDKTYYYGGEDYADHAILIVGWDDNLTVTGGSDSPSEDPKGAWIIKNSWGADWGDDGYAYVSYKDKSIGVVSAYWPSYEETTEYDNIYYYDNLGAIYTISGGESGGYGLVKFNATGKEHVKKIGTFIVAAATTLDIEIYDTKSGFSLSNLLYSEQGISCPHYGYYSFDVSAIVEDDFYVKIKYNCPYRGDVIPIETEVVDYAYPWIERDVCWVSGDDDEWTAVGRGLEGLEYDLCIRAYASEAGNIQASFVANKNRLCIGAAITYTSNSYGNITGYSWNFGEGAIPSTSDILGPHFVTYSSAGLKSVTLTVTGTEGSNTFTRNEFIHVTTDINVEIPYTNINVGKGDEFTLSAFGADSYSWSPSTNLNKTTGAEVITTANYDSIIYTVTGTQGACTDKAEVKVYGRENEWNDICDAQELSLGLHGPYHNFYATIEIGEPHPQFGECNTQNSWCDEYQYTAPGKSSLENSVWFKFAGTESGNASFQLINAIPPYIIDPQIAIYKAAECDDLFDAEWDDVGIAANDDYFDDDNSKDDYFNLYSSVIELSNNYPKGSNYYWIQVDGSGGGRDVVFYLEIKETEHTYYDEPLGIAENIISQNQPFSIYPNPSDGNFTLSYTGNGVDNVCIEFIDISARIIYSKNYDYIPVGFNTNISLNNLSKGIYLVKLRTEKEYQIIKVILK